MSFVAKLPLQVVCRQACNKLLICQKALGGLATHKKVAWTARKGKSFSEPY
jgi:hypothetical protein